MLAMAAMSTRPTAVATAFHAASRRAVFAAATAHPTTGRSAPGTPATFRRALAVLPHALRRRCRSLGGGLGSLLRLLVRLGIGLPGLRRFGCDLLGRYRADEGQQRQPQPATMGKRHGGVSCGTPGY